MADQNRTVQSDLLLEGVHEVDPSAQRVGALPLGVPEGRQVKREDSMVVAKSAADALPDRARNDEASEQDDWRPASSPASIGDKLAADAQEWPCVKLSRRLDPACRCKVVGARSDRQNDEQLEQR